MNVREEGLLYDVDEEVGIRVFEKKRP